MKPKKNCLESLTAETFTEWGCKYLQCIIPNKKFCADPISYVSTNQSPGTYSQDSPHSEESPRSSHNIVVKYSSMGYSVEPKPDVMAKMNYDDLALEQIVDDVDNMYR